MYTLTKSLKIVLIIGYRVDAIVDIWVNCPCFTFLFKVLVYYFGLFTLLLAYFLGNNPEGDLGVFFKEVQGDLNFTFFLIIGIY